jgi:hypothetical protein
MSKAKHPILSKYNLIESKSSRGTSMFGYCIFDGPPIMLSDDKDTVLDHIYSLQRGKKQFEPLTLADPASAHFGSAVERVHDEDYHVEDEPTDTEDEE